MTIRPRAYLVGAAFSVPLWVIIVAALRGALSHSYLVDVAIIVVAFMAMFFVAGVLGIFHAYVAERRSARFRNAMNRMLELDQPKVWR